MPSFLTALRLDRIDAWLVMSLKASVYLAGAALLTFLLGKLFRRIRRLSAELIRERGGADAEVEKQTDTIASISRRVLFSLIWILAVVLALREYKFDVGPVLAGAGVVGLAVGFAAQSVLKDWIGGLFLLTEGQIRIGDVIKIGDLAGTVEQLSLRTTVLRGYDGNVHVFANGSVQSFSNLTLGHSYAVFDLAAGYGEDPELLSGALREAGDELRADAEFGPLVLDGMEVAGVDRFTEQGVVVKARIRTRPSQQWKVAREVNRRVRLKCAERGITIATAQRAVQIFEKGFDHDSDPAQSTRRP
ncbi:MAG: mechanosensitive ion channel family protein [Candidatus Solibacter usitatus]|nr:mechanosensitive ion channel family protein [Candidatus Solibacter usitatus]